MSLTKVTYSMINGPQINAADYGGFTATSTAAENMAALNAAKAAVNASSVRSTPIYVPCGEFDIDNSIPFEIVAGLVLRGMAQPGQEDRGTIFNLTAAQPMFQATGDYVSDWELSGFSIDYKNVTNSQTTADCIGVKISGGVAQGASRFLIRNIIVNKPHIGFEDLSPVSFGYTVQDFQVILPGNKGLSVDGGGTSKLFLRPVINGYVAGGNNDGFYVNGQGLGVTIRDAVFDGLAGRQFYIVDSNVSIEDPYIETLTTNLLSDGIIVAGNDISVNIKGLIYYTPRLNVNGSAVIRVQGGANVLLDSIKIRGAANVGSGAVSNLNIASPTSATQVTLINSPSIKVPPILYAGSGAYGIFDDTGKVRIVEPNQRLTTPVTQTGGSEKILMTTTIPANTINNGGGIRATASGTWSGSAGTKTLIFYYGSKQLILLSANENQTLRFASSPANAADSCTQNLMIVETTNTVARICWRNRLLNRTSSDNWKP
jgi:hypothetical protein